ncbi:MAG: hypothetical protein AMJ38_01840 [Dehalococcoidia bacterium DG_22]|nr:MAG: hypothetical protein AMJ38_01840 [Dehalococcoidia bacterium DG_22]
MAAGDEGKVIMVKGGIERPFEYEYRPGEELVLRFRRPMLDLIPAEVHEHLVAGRKELLLAMRSFVDAAISRVEEREQARTRRRSEIKVE